LEVWGVGTHQVFGAAIGAGLVSNLNNRQLSSAFGIAGTGAPVPSAMKWGWDSGPISWMKDTVAWSAIAGTISVYLAKAGFEGCHDILDGRHGFWVMASSDRFDPTEITCELGHTFRFLDMAIKPYPCCRYAHSTIDAILEITSGQTFLSNEIDKINIYSVSDLASYMNRPRPESLVEAQFSMPFLAAVSIAKGGLNPANMGDQRILEDSEILKISQKVYVTADPEADRIYNATHSEIRTRVEFIFTDGRKQTATVCFPRGERVNPIQRDDVLEKFDQMASPRLGSRGAFDLRNHIMRLETVPAVKSLLAMLGG
jgi:2-methylcitrate dehydratase PrpD